MNNIKIRVRPNYILCMLVIIIILLINFSVSKYKYLITENGNAKIAEPIIVFEQDENLEIEYNKKTGQIEYAFKIKNYNDTKINEVDFLYNIEIIGNDNNFPVEYKLINTDTNEIVNLVNNKSENFKIGTLVKEEDSYKVVVNWKDKSIDAYSNSLMINLKANIIQSYC